MSDFFWGIFFAHSPLLSYRKYHSNALNSISFRVWDLCLFTQKLYGYYRRTFFIDKSELTVCTVCRSRMKLRGTNFINFHVSFFLFVDDRQNSHFYKVSHQRMPNTWHRSALHSMKLKAAIFILTWLLLQTTST